MNTSNVQYDENNKGQSNKSQLNSMPKYKHTNETLIGEKIVKSEEYQSTSDQHIKHTKNKPENTSKGSDEKSKNIIHSIKSFFKF